MSDYDRENWQAEQAARDEAQGAYRDKMARARERSAANAKRKIARLHAKLTELGHISEFEDEFGESVLERLDKFGSAFHDREKGRAGDALSLAQKQVVARMNKKVKDLKKKQVEKAGSDPDADYVRTADRWKNGAKDGQKRNGFKSKRKPKFTPRVRQIEDEMLEDEMIEAAPPPSRNPSAPNSPPLNLGPPKLASVTEVSQLRKSKPYIPDYAPPPKAMRKSSGGKRPFLRIVPKDSD